MNTSAIQGAPNSEEKMVLYMYYQQARRKQGALAPLVIGR